MISAGLKFNYLAVEIGRTGITFGFRAVVACAGANDQSASA